LVYAATNVTFSRRRVLVEDVKKLHVDVLFAHVDDADNVAQGGLFQHHGNSFLGIAAAPAHLPEHDRVRFQWFDL
jgi:hypothetical protein